MIKSMDEYQLIVTKWGAECFGNDHINSPNIRGQRLCEEAIEFCQSVGVDASLLHALIDYVYARPSGSPQQELGGIAVTAMVAASSLGYKFSEVLNTEIERVLSKTKEHFATRNQQKLDAGFK